MLVCMLDVPKNLILAGWWSVDHHSTEYLIIGILIIPSIEMADKIFGKFSFSLKNLKERMNKI